MTWAITMIRSKRTTMGWLGGKEITKGAPTARTIPHRFRPPHSSAQLSVARTTSHRYFFLSLPLDARNTLQKRGVWRIRVGMNDTLEATASNEANLENGLKIVSGTRGREFESHRPDHLSNAVFAGENEHFARQQSEAGIPCRTTGAQNAPGSEPDAEQPKVRFPKIIRNKKTKVEVTIYGKSKGGERKPDGSVTQPYPSPSSSA